MRSATASSTSPRLSFAPGWTAAAGWRFSRPVSRRISSRSSAASRTVFVGIALQADWYTGDCVFEAPGEPKVTDLDWAATKIARGPDGAITVHGQIQTPLGAILRVMTFEAEESISPSNFSWGRGSLRLGHITLLRGTFDPDSLSFATTMAVLRPSDFHWPAKRSSMARRFLSWFRPPAPWA
jgi:hypothetical protein